MQPPRQVPGIAQLRQQFSRDTLPPVQSPLAPPQSPESAIGAQMHDLALEIYSRLAVEHLTSNPQSHSQLLQEMARSAQMAAKSYFEAMGVKFDG